jgi:HD-like signal output (HDOD) protein
MGNPNTVYVSGMLHDIGIIIYQYFKEESGQINGLMKERRLPRLAAEREVFSIDHAGIGALLLEMWDIPGAIAESVKLHHSPKEIGEKENPYVTWLANGLAKQVDFEADLPDFRAFFEKQREMLHTEMPDEYLLKAHVELFETAYDQLRGIDAFLEEAPKGDA